jgi:uncharacterized protein (TIGR03382 family)
VSKIGLSTLAVLAVAGTSMAQTTFPTATAGLQLNLVGRTAGAAGALAWGSAGTSVGVDNSSSAQTVRFEVRYNISDSDANDGWDILGVAGTAFDIRSNIPAASGATIGLARHLTTGNTDPSAAVNTPINSGTFATPAGTQIGLIAPFRPNAGNNGVLGTGFGGNLGTTSGNPVIPLQLSAPAAGPALNTDYNMYAFNITIPVGVPAGQYQVTLANLDPTGLFYGINSNDPNDPGNTYTWGSTTSGATTVTITVVPAPGAAALLGLGGLLAARRRRA